MSVISNFSFLLKRFPQFTMSYETMQKGTMDESEYNLCVCIPNGKKYFAWFSFYQDKNVCFFMELNREKKIISVSWKQIAAPFPVFLGTILFGTLLDSRENIFIVEDIFYHQGIPLTDSLFCDKLGYLSEFLHKQSDFATTTSFYLSTMFWNGGKDGEKIAPYPIHHKQYRCLSKISPYLNEKSTNLLEIREKQQQQSTLVLVPVKCIYSKPQYKQKTIFQVMAEVKFDIYLLYAYGNDAKCPVFYDIAYIPNYKISVYMNGLFRTIRENTNLDWIEESDDEDDFENIDENKYVNLDKKILMECVFHNKFKKWVPVNVVKDSTKQMISLAKL